MRSAGPLMSRASELLFRRRPVSTGLPELDGLIGGLRPGALHIFYGDSQLVDAVLYRVMVEASRRGEVAYLNNTDYYGEKTLIDSATLAAVSKMAGVEPLRVLSSIHCAAAFNAARQVRASERLAETIVNRGKMSLVAVHNASAFLEKGLGDASSALAKSVSILMEAASRASAPLVVTAATEDGSPDGLEASPRLPYQVLERAAVVVFFRSQRLWPRRQAGQARLAPLSEDRLPSLQPLVVGRG